MPRPVRLTAALYGLTWLVNRSLRRVAGPSMEPTLRAGDLVLTVPARPRVGDVVAWSVDGVGRPGGRWRLKRIAGVGPGTVELPTGAVPLRPGEVFLLGDDLDRSTDSRSHGPVQAASVRRRAVAVVWPRPRRLRRQPASAVASTSSSGSSRRTGPAP